MREPRQWEIESAIALGEKIQRDWRLTAAVPLRRIPPDNIAQYFYFSNLGAPAARMWVSSAEYPLGPLVFTIRGPFIIRPTLIFRRLFCILHNLNIQWPVYYDAHLTQPINSHTTRERPQRTDRPIARALPYPLLRLAIRRCPTMRNISSVEAAGSLPTSYAT